MADFTQAIKWMKDGGKVRRENWRFGRYKPYLYIENRSPGCNQIFQSTETSDHTGREDSQTFVDLLSEIEATDWEIYEEKREFQVGDLITVEGYSGQVLGVHSQQLDIMLYKLGKKSKVSWDKAYVSLVTPVDEIKELKTLKDIQEETENPQGLEGWVFVDDLRQDAIKWVKSDKIVATAKLEGINRDDVKAIQNAVIMYRNNLSEEDFE